MKLLKALLVFIIGVSLFIGVSQAFALDWHTANQATVQWIAVTALDNGNPIPEGAVIKYRVYLSNAITDPNKTNPAEVGTTADITYTLTLNTEGMYYVGISAFRLDGTEEVAKSTIAWSDDAIYCLNGVTFGVRYYIGPAPPKGLSTQ